MKTPALLMAEHNRDTEIVALLNDLARIQGRGRYFGMVPTDPQQRILDSKEPEIAAFFGNQAGKTWMIGYILCALAHGRWTPRGAAQKDTYYAWVSCQTSDMMRNYMLKMLYKVCPQSWFEPKLYHSQATLRGPAATVHIGFKSVEQGAARYAGDNIDVIFLDEPHPFDIYTECLVRILATRGVIISTMTAVHENIDWQEKYYEDKFHVFAPTDSNPYLDPKEIDRLFKGMTEVERQVRRTGRFADMSGSKFLDRPEMNFVKDTAKSPVASLSVATVQGATYLTGRTASNEVGVFDQHIDSKGLYVAGLDIGTGSGQDRTVLKVFRVTWNPTITSCVATEVCCFESKATKIPVIIDVCLKICRSYNNALLNIDRSGIGEPVIQEMVLRRGYTHFTGRMHIEDMTLGDKWGFKFTAESRNLLLQELRLAICNRCMFLVHPRGAEEIDGYKYHVDKHRYDHGPGGHDDHIMAAGLGWLAVRQVEHIACRNYERDKTRTPELLTWEQLEEYEKQFEEIAYEDF